MTCFLHHLDADLSDLAEPVVDDGDRCGACGGWGNHGEWGPVCQRCNGLGDARALCRECDVELDLGIDDVDRFDAVPLCTECWAYTQWCPQHGHMCDCDELELPCAVPRSVPKCEALARIPGLLDRACFPSLIDGRCLHCGRDMEGAA